jgi:DNA-binding SARP family transcriptional activator
LNARAFEPFLAYRVAPRKSLRRDRLIDELWDVKQPQTAATALQVDLSQLRNALGRDLIARGRPEA